MYSSLQRANHTLSLALSVLFGLLAAIALSSFVLLPASVPGATISVEPLSIVLGKNKYQRAGREQEFAFARFDVDTDLTPLFHWNTKQVFLQLTAEYLTPGSTPNSVVLWDRTVRSPATAKVALQSARNSFPFKEVSHSFRDVTNVSYALSYHVMPYVGVLQSGEVARSSEVLAKLPKPKANV